MDSTVIEHAKKYIEDLFADNADGHDAEHTMRVYRNALEIAREYPECDLFIVSLSALLHDADDHKLFHTENNANARAFLRQEGIGEDMSGRILEAINSVSFSQNRGKHPGTIEGRIVQDADRLDAVGAVGIARTFAYGGRNGRPLSSSLGHFDEKLLLLKDEMNTPKAKEMAASRHAFMEEFLRQYHKETDGEENHED